MKGTVAPEPSFNQLGDTWSATGTGYGAGIAAGYNFQRENFVYGVEFDYGWLGIKSKAYSNITDDTLLTTNMSDLTTARLRFGYAIDRALLFVTVGGAMGHFNSYVSDPDMKIGIMTQPTSAQFGFVIGVGAEYAITEKLRLKLDFLNMGFAPQKSTGYVNVTCAPTNPGDPITCPPNWKMNRLGMAFDGTAAWDLSHTLSVIRVGLNYSF